MSHVIFSLDLETIGLFGPAFAAGWVLMDAHTGLIDRASSGYAYFHPHGLDSGLYHNSDFDWIEKHVLPHLETQPHLDVEPRVVRGHARLLGCVWKAWTDAKEHHKATMLADCPFPVESTFMREMAMVCGNGTFRDSIYPVIDLESYKRAAYGTDSPPADLREEGEHEHHAYFDALVAAREYKKARERTRVGGRECLLCPPVYGGISC
jgi:hypothetical protein